MPRSSDGGTSKLVWWMMGLLATIVTTIAVVLITGALSKISDHSDRITKLEVKQDALETRVISVEADIKRKLNPRPWESRQPERRNP
jgi:membrane protein implicated in regulation of membrane protease activity